MAMIHNGDFEIPYLRRQVCFECESKNVSARAVSTCEFCCVGTCIGAGGLGTHEKRSTLKVSFLACAA